ncbi:Oidioi.mRNA.OKI2018_I69.chr1.g1997.t1.cds [Oikopleura dioica]|uniref:Oidioi.mRNA.OKI2018_I69.chr1.g1997.t1.cds n=1 Tax=Oikopleura dioica TaxID=34765 RepID=A0ABN7STJ8_OIKDI|nr:Oidioi.mRNA.OKI2018_I69.chr1.g1997.t1.cds [Oikopleura dioica]
MPTLKISPAETNLEKEVTKYIDDESKDPKEDVCPPKISVDLEAAQCDEPQSGRSFEEIPVQRSNPRLDIHRDFQRSGRINVSRNIGVFSLALFGSAVCQGMSTAYVVANGNISNRNNIQPGTTNPLAPPLIVNGNGDRDRTEIIDDSFDSYDSYENYNYGANPLAPPTYDEYPDYPEDDEMSHLNRTKWSETGEVHKNGTVDPWVDDYNPDDIDLSYDEAYIRGPVPIVEVSTEESAAPESIETTETTNETTTKESETTVESQTNQNSTTAN